jgi:hypothetical protein
MSDRGETQLDLRTSRKPRRVAAILLSLLSAGLGHVAIGYWRRAIFWYGILLCTGIALVLSTLLAAPWAMWAAIAVAWTVQNSRDSRDFGALPIALVESKARFVWWSSGPEGIRWSRINQRVE